jgi:hypothetical protein
VSARFSSSWLGVTSEAFADALHDYVAANPDGKLREVRRAASREAVAFGVWCRSERGPMLGQAPGSEVCTGERGGPGGRGRNT